MPLFRNPSGKLLPSSSEPRRRVLRREVLIKPHEDLGRGRGDREIYPSSSKLPASWIK